MSNNPSSEGGDDNFFSELLSQFGASDSPEGEDEELAAFMSGLENGSKENEEKVVQDMLQDLPALSVQGPLSSQSGVKRLLGDLADGDDADEILAAFSDPPAETHQSEQTEAISLPEGETIGLSSEAVRVVPSELESAPALNTGRVMPAPPPSVEPIRSPTTAAEDESLASMPEMPPEPVDEGLMPAGLTLKELFGIDGPTGDGEPAEGAQDKEDAGDISRVDDPLAPRKMFAVRRLHRFFVEKVQSRSKLAILRFLMMTGLESVSVSEFEESLFQEPEALGQSLEQLQKDGILISDKRGFSLNPRSRSLVLVGTLVSNWQNPELRKTIWQWIQDEEL